MNVPFIDFSEQYQTIKDRIDVGLKAVFEKGNYILMRNANVPWLVRVIIRRLFNTVHDWYAIRAIGIYYYYNRYLIAFVCKVHNCCSFTGDDNSRFCLKRCN